MPARDIVAQLAREVILLDHPLRCADFAVLIALDVPPVLVELGCLSNPSEEPFVAAACLPAEAGARLDTCG